MRLKRSLAGVIALIVVTSIVAVGASASSGKRHDAGNQIAGTWIVNVVRPAPAPPLTSLQAFTAAGSVIESANDGSASRSPAYGSWERVEGRHYANTTVFFRFDPQTGAWIGSQKINRTIELSDDGQSFTQVSHVSVLDTNGNVLASFTVPGTGRRMQVES